jgi:hypothetical protein
MKIKYKRTADKDWATGKSELDLYNFLTTIKDSEAVVVRINCPHTKTHIEAGFVRCVVCRDVIGEVG